MAHEHRLARAVPRNLIDHLNHEIRSPLTVLVGMTELLSLTSLTAEQQQCVANMQKAVSSMLTLVGSAVDFSRLNAGELSLQTEAFSLRDELEQVRGSLAAGHGANGASLEIAVDGAVPDRLLGDASRLRQILASLTSHAVRVRRVRQLALRVALSSQAADAAVLEFSVADQLAPPPTPGEDRLPPGKCLAFSAEALGGSSGPGLELIVAAGLAALMHGRIWIAASSGGIVSQFTATFGVP